MFTINFFSYRHGCNTAIASRRLHKCQESANTLMAATGSQCLPLQMDVRNVSQIDSIMVSDALTRGLRFFALHWRPMIDYIIFLTYDIKICYLSLVISFIFDILRHITTFLPNAIRCFSWWCKMMSLIKFRVLTSFLTLRVSCLSLWSRQNFLAPLKIEQTLSHR